MQFPYKVSCVSLSRGHLFRKGNELRCATDNVKRFDVCSSWFVCDFVLLFFNLSNQDFFTAWRSQSFSRSGRFVSTAFFQGTFQWKHPTCVLMNDKKCQIYCLGHSLCVCLLGSGNVCFATMRASVWSEWFDHRWISVQLAAVSSQLTKRKGQFGYEMLR